MHLIRTRMCHSVAAMAALHSAQIGKWVFKGYEPEGQTENKLHNEFEELGRVRL